MAVRFCENVNATRHGQNCLLKYITVPFTSPPLYHRHQNMWQVPQIAKIIGEFGYNVDVINYDDEITKLTKTYDLLIDIYPQNGKMYEQHLSPNCIKIFYSTGAAPDWQNAQQLARVKAINERRHTNLRPKALVQPFNHELDDFDAMFLIGNDFTLKTYSDIPIKQVFFLKNSAYLFPLMDFCQKTPNTFLYLATYPQALKGLDLLLDVFKTEPAVSLSIFPNPSAGRASRATKKCAYYHHPARTGSKNTNQVP